MENGHSYQSEYALRFGERADHPATQRDVVDELRRRYATDWHSLWSSVYSHHEACMVAALRALDAALREPKVTRHGLRCRVVAALAAIAERRPEAVPLRTQEG